MTPRNSLRLSGSRLIASLLALAIIIVGVVFLRIVHGTPPPFGDPHYIG